MAKAKQEKNQDLCLQDHHQKDKAAAPWEKMQSKT
jgi:hypothetical protein